MKGGDDLGLGAREGGCGRHRKAAVLNQQFLEIEGGRLYDEEQVFVELLTAAVTVTAPREIADYSRAFVELSQMALYGAAARGLIAAAISALA